MVNISGNGNAMVKKCANCAKQLDWRILCVPKRGKIMKCKACVKQEAIKKNPNGIFNLRAEVHTCNQLRWLCRDCSRTHYQELKTSRKVDNKLL